MKVYSQEEARHILCRYHNIDGAEALYGKTGVEKIMQRIHSIQYDPLNVVSRNADLVLQARVRGYEEKDLYNLLYKEHKLIDGPDKEMCIYSIKDFANFKYVRNEVHKSVISTLQYRNQMGALDILDDVKEFVEKHGKTGTKDISIGEVTESRWGHKKLSSAALDYLFNSGELCVVDKCGTQKYFDLTERVIDSQDIQCDQNMTIEEFLEWYVERRIQSVGFIWNKMGGAWQGHLISKNEIRKATLQRLIEKNKIEEIQVEGINEIFYISKEIQPYLNIQTSNSYARFIAPLDNIMWDRKMIEKLFGFTYRWEVYTPVAKRKYGYYVLPVLYNDQFVARFEAEPVRQAGEFVIKNWWWEPGIKPDDDMIETVAEEMRHFAHFLQVENSKNNITKLGVRKNERNRKI